MDFDNVAAFELFSSLSGGWQRDMDGRCVGMRPEAVEAVMRMRRIPLADRSGLFDDIQLMAGEAMHIWSKKK